jgi:hypothetical protein
MPEAPSAEVLVDRSHLNQIPSAQARDKIVVSHVTESRPVDGVNSGPEFSMTDEADAILNDDFGDDDDW